MLKSAGHALLADCLQANRASSISQAYAVSVKGDYRQLRHFVPFNLPPEKVCSERVAEPSIAK